MWTYLVEYYRNIGTESSPIYAWVQQKNIYYGQLDIDSWQLKDVEGRRRNAHLIQVYFK